MGLEDNPMSKVLSFFFRATGQSVTAYTSKLAAINIIRGLGIEKTEEAARSSFLISIQDCS